MEAGSQPAGGALPITDGQTGEEVNQEELLRDAENAFGEIFPTKAPRDVFAGLWSGIKCVLSGVCLGAVGAIVQPIQGMQSEGVPGCFKGVAAGLCTGLFLSITGICTGVYMAIRGALATPKAICMTTQGKRWDREAATWVEPTPYSLPEEIAQVLGDGDDDDDEDVGGGGTDAAATSSGGRRVADTYYYDQLGVSTSASQRDIRKAYFQLSRKWHPDKTTEAQAKENFQAISEAYQVLSDPSRRRAYDAKGRSAGESFVDAQVFFKVLFSADVLEPFIGRLRIAELFRDLGASATSPEGAAHFAQQTKESERAELKQVRREVRLARALVERLRPFEAERAGFREANRKEAREMIGRDRSLARFLAEIGWVYRNRAELYLASQGSRLGSYGVTALGLHLRGRGHEAQQSAKTARLAVTSLLELRKIVRETAPPAKEGEAQPEGTPAEGEEQSQELPPCLTNALPVFMETFWSLSARDITGTLQKVADRVLEDSSVSAAERQVRAEGLCELGGAFLQEAAAAAGASGSEEGGDVRRFEDALMASLGQGQSPPE